VAKKDELSTLKAWLLVLSSLLDEAVLLVLIFLALRYFHIKITWPVILAAGLAVVVFFFIIHKAVIPSLRRRKTTGAEGMIGLTGEVTQALKPEGVIKINGEYWKAKSVDGDTDIDEEVEVVGITGLILEVKRKNP
jgi:membrane protein implicated in regulation of membrane protease activity